MTSEHVWQRSAACGGRGDLDWIEPTAADAAECREICAGCEVRAECADAAVAVGEPWGIWGGLDASERALLAAVMGNPAPRVLPAHGTNPRYAKHGCRCAACRAAHTENERRRRNRLARLNEFTMPDGATA